MGYCLASQPSLDNNTVDMDRERANFVDNAVRYESHAAVSQWLVQNHAQAITGQ